MNELENLKIATADSLDYYHQIAQKLWNYFPQEQRCCLWEKEKALQVLLDKNKIWKCCFAVSKNKVRCIHFDCLGMCFECINNVLTYDKCPSCKAPMVGTNPMDPETPYLQERKSSMVLIIFTDGAYDFI